MSANLETGVKDLATASWVENSINNSAANSSIGNLDFDIDSFRGTFKLSNFRLK